MHSLGPVSEDMLTEEVVESPSLETTTQEIHQ